MRTNSVKVISQNQQKGTAQVVIEGQTYHAKRVGNQYETSRDRDKRYEFSL